MVESLKEKSWVFESDSREVESRTSETQDALRRTRTPPCLLPAAVIPAVDPFGTRCFS